MSTSSCFNPGSQSPICLPDTVHGKHTFLPHAQPKSSLPSPFTILIFHLFPSLPPPYFPYLLHHAHPIHIPHSPLPLPQTIPFLSLPFSERIIDPLRSHYLWSTFFLVCTTYLPTYLPILWCALPTYLPTYPLIIFLFPVFVFKKREKYRYALAKR